MFKLPQRTTIQVAGIFCLLLASYHLIFRDFFPLPNGLMGHDYVLTLGGFLDGYLWYRNNGFISPPWFTPSFCGGQALFADPQSAFYSIPQFLSFLVDPLQAVYWSLLFFAGLGLWGMYLYSKNCLELDSVAALVAATAFMFNGFYSHRMIIGHYGYQSFMLIPIIAYLLLQPNQKHGKPIENIRPTLLAGILIAYWFHSGLTTLIVPAALAVVILACLTSICTTKVTINAFFIRGTLAALIAIGLSASKLNANLTLIGKFSRDYYPLPGLSSASELLGFVFQSLFYSSEHVFRWVTPLWKNMQWSALPHELAFGLTPITFIVLLIGFGVRGMAGNTLPSLPLTKFPISRAIALVGMVIILPIPMALLYYAPEWNATLKQIPLIGSTTSPFRWLIIYIPFIAALAGIATKVAGKFNKIIFTLVLAGVPALNLLENRDYYQAQSFDPHPIVNFYEMVKRGEISPSISQIGDPKNEENQSVIDNSLFLKGASPMRCYNPLFGYRLEKLITTPLTSGSVTKKNNDNFLNIHNPACLIFPEENNCHPWDSFSVHQIGDLQNFTAYRPYAFEKSKRQHFADWMNLAFIAAIAALVIFPMINSAKIATKAAK